MIAYVLAAFIIIVCVILPIGWAWLEDRANARIAAAYARGRADQQPVPVDTVLYERLVADVTERVLSRIVDAQVQQQIDEAGDA